MSKVYFRKYGESTTFNFDLFEIDGIDFKTDTVHVSGDTKLMKDEGAEANTTNGFTDEGQGYSIVLTATEMEYARGRLYIVDQGTKAWLDTGITIETYGHASAQHPNFGEAMRGTDNAALDATVAKEATLGTHETNRATMETTLVAEHDATQVDISNHETNRATMETTLVAEHDATQVDISNHETNRADMETTLVAEHDATQVDISNLDVPDNASIATILSEVQNVTYGLSAIQVLIGAIDSTTELQAKFDEIKGVGWTDETLLALKGYVDDLETRLTQVRADGMPPATMSRV